MHDTANTLDAPPRGTALPAGTIRVNLGHLVHADVGVAGRRCRWQGRAGGWRELARQDLRPRWWPGSPTGVAQPVLAGVGLVLAVAVAFACAWGLAGLGLRDGASSGPEASLSTPPAAPPMSRVEGGVPAVRDGAGTARHAAHAAPFVVPPTDASRLASALSRQVAAAAPATPESSAGTAPPGSTEGPSARAERSVPAPAAAAPGSVGLRPLPVLAQPSGQESLDGGLVREPLRAADASPAPATSGGVAPHARGGLAETGEVDVSKPATPGAPWREGAWDAVRAAGPPQPRSDHAVRPQGVDGTPSAGDAAGVPAPVPDGPARGAGALAAPLATRIESGGPGLSAARGDDVVRKAARPGRKDGRQGGPRGAARMASVSNAPKATAPPDPQPEEGEAKVSAWTRAGGRERLVAIVDAHTVVMPDARGLPARFRIGDRLPSGARVVAIDPDLGRADTDRGALHLE